MFDLQYYNTLIKNNYKICPLVDMLITDESIMLNDHLIMDHKKQLLQEKIDILNDKLKKENLLVYPCLYTEHLKNKNKFRDIIKYDSNIYLIFICPEYNMREIVTTSKATKKTQKLVLQKCGFQYQ